eukprot:TRINITY_DN25322_c0_g1_i2.p1 TRINITY_DN25322_c0_g1~~TRINITY_DN25322_c0_g1_i2.p1  ORF type:complete len:245 (+),score=45.73 TRINITY_DN25322_c0_g1_i2:58-792(+)
MPAERIDLDGQCWCDLYKDFVGEEEAAALLSELRGSDLNWSYVHLAHGSPLPRGIAWVCTTRHRTAYEYGGGEKRMRMDPQSMPAQLDRLRNRVEGATGLPFNCALLNHYRSGKDRIRWHQDREPLFGESPQVASVSLGAARGFWLRESVGEGETARVVKLTLPPNSLLVMGGRTQERWQHSVPKQSEQKEERWNITFREIVSAAAGAVAGSEAAAPELPQTAAAADVAAAAAAAPPSPDKKSP